MNNRKVMDHSENNYSTNEPESAFSGSYSSIEPRVYTPSERINTEQYTIGKLVQGIFIFFFGLPFLAGPIFMLTMALKEMPYIAAKIFVVIFIIPFLIVGLLISFSGIITVLSVITKKPLYKKFQFFKKSSTEPLPETISTIPPPSQHRYCMYCGAKIPTNASKCPQCGALLTE